MRPIPDHRGFFPFWDNWQEKNKSQTKLLVNNKIISILFWSGYGKGAFRQTTTPTVVTEMLSVWKACGSRLNC